MTIGKRIKSLREAKGLSVRQLAKLAGCAASHVTMIEKGQTNPSREKLQSFAKALSTTTLVLLHGKSGLLITINKLLKLIEQHGDYEDIETFRNICETLEFALLWQQQSRSRVKESILQNIHECQQKGNVPEKLKASLLTVQQDINAANVYMRALSRIRAGAIAAPSETNFEDTIQEHTPNNIGKDK